MVMDKTGNFLQMMVQDKMNRQARESSPQYRMAKKQLADYDEDRNFLKKRYADEEKSRNLKYEEDLIDWSVKSLNFIDFDEYPMFRETAIERGMNPSMFPEGFGSEEEFIDFKNRITLGAPEFIKFKKGQPATMSRVNDDGTISTIEAKTPEEITAASEEGYQMGNITGSPTKEKSTHKPVYDSTGRIKKWVTVKEGEDYQYGEGEFGSAPPAGTGSGKTPTARDAFKGISDIKKAKAILEKSDTVTAMIAAMNPELKDMVGQQIPADLKEELYTAWDNEIEYLNKFTGNKEPGTGLPEGLTEGMLSQYEELYPDKTREEIIEDYTKRYVKKGK